jgi:hypothetical protein
MVHVIVGLRAGNGIGSLPHGRSYCPSKLTHTWEGAAKPGRPAVRLIR